MSHHGEHEHERAIKPFADLHRTGDEVVATLLHDPTVEGLDMALYLDGSGSMSDEYDYPTNFSLFGWLFGNTEKDDDKTNVVEPQARWILEYLATKDRNGKLRAAYWATGSDGGTVEVIGEYTGKDVGNKKFPGPSVYGSSTLLAPAIKDFVEYIEQQQANGAKQGCAVFVTDGVIHDAHEVVELSEEIVHEVEEGHLPELNFILVGVGDGVDEEQMEEICHAEHLAHSHLWCHRVAEEIEDMAELVAVLVDETMTVAGGGTIYDDDGDVLKRYEGRLPAVLKFEVPDHCRAFTLEVGGKRYTQPLPAPGEHHGEEHHGGHH